MLTYLFIIFVIALALAPLAHFAPSKRQRQIARMREYAAVRGLFVEFRNLPGHRQVHGISGTSPRHVIYYGKRLSGVRSEQVIPGSWLRDEDGWRGVDRRLPVPDTLLELPAEILAASADQSSCGVYWMEFMGKQPGEQEWEHGVGQIQRVLEHWSTQLLH